MGQIREALARAGYGDAEEWPSEALRKIAEEAMIAHAADNQAAQRAIFDKCCPKNSLARALFAPWQRDACGALIAEIRRLSKAVEHAANPNSRQRRIAELTALEEARNERAAKEARQRVMEERARTEHARQEQLNEWLQNKARHEMIDGQHWWDVSPVRLAAFAKRTTHRSKFYALVLERLPDYDDKYPISYYLKSTEIDEMWDTAWGNEQHN